MNRVLRYVNAVIALLLLSGAIAVYWYVWRPTPWTGGLMSARVEQESFIVRDAYGVPHIRAKTLEDGFFAQGYATAQDRMWQMDMIRRYASGELSEILGPVTLSADIESRRLRLRRIAEVHAASLSNANRSMFAAYARGVNQYIDNAREMLPVEFSMLGYQPRPWSIVDSIVVGLHMYRTLTSSWQDELLKAQMLEGGDREKVEALFPVRSGRETAPGSNAWALSGKWTASGKPLLANDPHLEFSFPSTWYQVHIQAGDLNVTGVSLPGLPAVIVGHNQRIAWGVTNLGFDVQDLYIERLDPGSGQYLVRGGVEQARFETERIFIKGRNPHVFQQWITRHGPAGFLLGKRALALRWTATEAGHFRFPFLRLNRAGNWTEFRAALREFVGPGQNFVYADIDGNIGYQAAGLLPQRRNYNGDVPVDGISGEFEWDGYISFERLPSSFNPASGMIVTANQNPWPPQTPTRINGEFAAPYRDRQIRQRLAARKGWRAEDMLSVQTDVYSDFLRSLGRDLAAAADGNAELAEAATLLKEWNGQTGKDMAAPLIATLAYQHLRRMLGDAASPGKGSIYRTRMAPAVVAAFLRERPEGWCSDWNELLRKALSSALAEGRRAHGNDLRKWRWGNYLQVTIAHPVLSRIPWAGRYFRLGPVPMDGASTAVKQTTATLGPSMRFIADLADWENSLNNVTIGQSGHMFSGHFRDQWEHYLAGQSLPMQYAKITENKVLTLEPKAIISELAQRQP